MSNKEETAAMPQEEDLRVLAIKELSERETRFLSLRRFDIGETPLDEGDAAPLKSFRIKFTSRYVGKSLDYKTMQDRFRVPWEQMKELIQKNGGTSLGYEFIDADFDWCADPDMKAITGIRMQLRANPDTKAMSVYVNLKLPDDIQVQCLVIGNILSIFTPDQNEVLSDTLFPTESPVPQKRRRKEVETMDGVLQADQHNTIERPFSDTIVIGRVSCSQETIKDKQFEVYKLNLHTKDKTTHWPSGGFNEYIRFWLPTLLALKSQLSVELLNFMTEDNTLTGIRIGCIGFDAIKTLT